MFHRGHACDLSSRSVQAYTCKVMEALDRTRRVHQEAVLSLDHFEAMAKRIQVCNSPKVILFFYDGIGQKVTSFGVIVSFQYYVFLLSFTSPV